MVDPTLLKNVYLFKTLNESQLGEVAKIVEINTYLATDEIFEQGAAATALYVIQFGSVKIQQSGESGSQIEVAHLGTGSHFGEMAFLDDEKRSASAVSVERSEIATIPFEPLKKLLHSRPDIAVEFYKESAHFLCGRLRVTTTDLSYARENNFRHF